MFVGLVLLAPSLGNATNAKGKSVYHEPSQAPCRAKEYDARARRNLLHVEESGGTRRVVRQTLGRCERAGGKALELAGISRIVPQRIISRRGAFFPPPQRF